MKIISDYIKKQGYTESQAAAVCSTTYPKIYNLMQGDSKLFSVDCLIEIAYCLGLNVQIEVKQ